MSNITPDLDRLLWQIAESKDPSAIAKFEAANPHLVGELASRLALVDGLRRMKPLVQSGAVPAFKPTTFAPLIPTAWIATAIIGVGLLGTGSYFVTKSLTAPRETPPPVPVARLDAPKLPEQHPVVTQTPSTPEVTQSKPPLPNDQGAGEPEDNAGGPTLDLNRDKPLSSADHVDAKYKFNLEGAPLKTVLQAVAAQSGLTLDIAPGMANPTVSVNVDGQSGMEVLQKLGKQYGFSPFDQGHKTVLIIPAADGAGPTDIPVGG